jgi:integrase
MSIRKIKTPNGEIRWEVRGYEGGRGSRYVSKRFERKVDAYAFELEFEKKKAERAKNPFADVSFTGRTFNEEAEYWLAASQNRFSPGHLKRAQSVLASFEKAYGKVAAERITPEFLTQFQQKRLADGLRPNTVNRDTEVITAVLNHSVRHRRLPFNPSTGFRKLFKAQKEMSFWDQEEASSFLAFANDKYPLGIETRWIYVTYLLALNTAMRAGEIWGLQPCDLNEAQNTITIRRQFHRVVNEFRPPKGSKSKPKTRVVPCHSNLMSELHKLITAKEIRPHQTIFQNREGKPTCHDNFSDRVFMKDIEAWGGRKIRFHDLRHTATTLFIANGVDIKTVKEICGHADITTTMDYVHMVSGAIERVAERMAIMPTVQGLEVVSQVKISR